MFKTRTYLGLAAICAALGTGCLVPAAQVAHGTTMLPGTIYFTRASHIFVANADGTDAQALTTAGTSKDPDMMPAASRDGTHVAYVQWHEVSRDAPYGIYVISPDGSKRHISRADQYTLNPAWSPDGTQVAYDTMVYYGTTSYEEVVIRRIADDAALDLIGNRFAPPSSPTWSPDGRTIVVEQLNMVGSSFIEGLQALDYAAMRVSAHPTTEIAHPLTNDPSHSYNKPIYSPDGRFIACVRTTVNGTDGDLWIMNADGSGGHAIAHDAHYDRPAWSPDGRYLAYTRGSSVAIVSTATGATVATIADATGPAWGGRVAAQPGSTTSGGTPASPAPAVTILFAHLYALVHGQYQVTQTVSVKEHFLCAVFFRVTGADATGATGRLTMIYPGGIQRSFPLSAGKSTDGTPMLSTPFTFTSTPRAMSIVAQFIVQVGRATASTSVPFTLTP